MSSHKKNSRKKDSNEITLEQLKENTIIINGKIASLIIGIIENESILMRLIDDKQSYYESIF